MTNDETAPEQPLSEAQARRLPALLDTIMPASEDGAMPSASGLDFPAYVAEQAADFMPILAEILDRFDDEFSDCALPDRVALVQEYAATEAEAFKALLFRIYDCYYQDAGVRLLIGAVVSPPFPTGNTIDSGDWSTLDAVIAREKGYRR